jgi:hypothetical protein
MIKRNLRPTSKNLSETHCFIIVVIVSAGVQE